MALPYFLSGSSLLSALRSAAYSDSAWPKGSAEARTPFLLLLPPFASAR